MARPKPCAASSAAQCRVHVMNLTIADHVSPAEKIKPSSPKENGMKHTIALTAVMMVMALPAGALAGRGFSGCPLAGANYAATTPRGATLAHRIEQTDTREAEFTKEWYSTFPTLGFYWGRMAPLNSRLFGPGVQAKPHS